MTRDAADGGGQELGTGRWARTGRARSPWPSRRPRTAALRLAHRAPRRHPPGRRSDYVGDFRPVLVCAVALAVLRLLSMIGISRAGLAA